jgi:hypothetical protein
MNREFSRQEYGVKAAQGVVASRGGPTGRWLARSSREYGVSLLALIRGTTIRGEQ